MEGVEGRDAARRQGADAGSHSTFDERRRASRPRGGTAAALCRHRRPRQRHGRHRLWILAKPARRPRAPCDHVGEAEMPRRGHRHRLKAALALTSASTEWQLSALTSRFSGGQWRVVHEHISVTTKLETGKAALNLRQNRETADIENCTTPRNRAISIPFRSLSPLPYVRQNS